uniref:Uncharacterized protein n=1 Tax=Helianthus annuus TaxID=4232 RepID=A0A251SBB4_HELAN
MFPSLVKGSERKEKIVCALEIFFINTKHQGLKLAKTNEFNHLVVGLRRKKGFQVFICVCRHLRGKALSR